MPLLQGTFLIRRYDVTRWVCSWLKRDSIRQFRFARAREFNYQCSRFCIMIDQRGIKVAAA